MPMLKTTKKIVEFTAFGMPSVELATMLMPKNELCDGPFLVVVDNTKFIGHPTTVLAPQARVGVVAGRRSPFNATAAR